MPNENELRISTPELRTFLAGTKIHTVRRGHRTFDKSIRLFTYDGSYYKDAVVNTFVHSVLAEVPLSILMEKGFRTYQEFLDTMRVFYPDISITDEVTIVEMRCASL